MFKKALNTVINLFFPHLCFICEKKVSDHGVLCNECTKKISFLNPPLCLGCSKKIKQSSQFCPKCQKKNLYYNKLICCTEYKEPIKMLTHLLKYKNHDYLADFLSSLIIDYLKRIGFEGTGFDFITSVPSHSIRLREREYNQSHLLAKRLSTFLKIPLKSDIIFCKKNLKSQSRLKESERHKNVKNNFIARASAKNKNIILIDDITTTGSTIAECAKALKNEGAKNITVITLAKARPTK